MFLAPKYCHTSHRISKKYWKNGCQGREIGQHVGVAQETVGQLQHFTVIATGKYLLWLLSKLLRIRKIWFLADILLLHGLEVRLNLLLLRVIY